MGKNSGHAVIIRERKGRARTACWIGCQKAPSRKAKGDARQGKVRAGRHYPGNEQNKCPLGYKFELVAEKKVV